MGDTHFIYFVVFVNAIEDEKQLLKSMKPFILITSLDIMDLEKTLQNSKINFRIVQDFFNILIS